MMTDQPTNQTTPTDQLTDRPINQPTRGHKGSWEKYSSNKRSQKARRRAHTHLHKSVFLLAVFLLLLCLLSLLCWFWPFWFHLCLLLRPLVCTYLSFSNRGTDLITHLGGEHIYYYDQYRLAQKYLQFSSWFFIFIYYKPKETTISSIIGQTCWTIISIIGRRPQYYWILLFLLVYSKIMVHL